MFLSSLLLCLTLAATGTSAQEIFLGPLSQRQHRVGGNVYLLSERVFEVREFSYDGLGPAVYWWIDTDGNPSEEGKGIVSPNNPQPCSVRLTGLASNGDRTVRVELPEGESIDNYLGGSLSVWCEEFNANFGHVTLPGSIDRSLLTGNFLPQCVDGMLVASIARTPEGYNCEELSDTLQVRWKVSDDMSQVNFDLIGEIDPTEYMAFGLSGSPTTTAMIGGDVVVTDGATGEFRARDIFLSARSPCIANGGVCPDTQFMFTNDARDVSGSTELGLTQISYTRPLTSTDTNNNEAGVEVDQAINLTGEQAVIWAIGPINPNTDLPQIHSSRTDPASPILIDFGREVTDNCVPLEPVVGPPPSTTPFVIPRIEATTLTAHIGPSGGPRGYQAITGESPWGIAWYINGQLIPEVVMRRNTTYTIMVNGGTDPSIPEAFHPMYLTTSRLGGYSVSTNEERTAQTIFAGLEIGATPDDFTPTAIGPLCMVQTTDETIPAIAEGRDYDIFLASLDASCANDITSQAGMITFTPDENTPDEIFYQCVTHQNLGWRIIVADEGEEVTSFSVEKGALLSLTALVAAFLAM